MRQAEDRAHRIGQKNCVTCIYLLGEHTLDDKIYAVLQKKENILGQILDGRLNNIRYDAEISYNQVEWKGV